MWGCGLDLRGMLFDNLRDFLGKDFYYVKSVTTLCFNFTILQHQGSYYAVRDPWPAMSFRWWKIFLQICVSVCVRVRVSGVYISTSVGPVCLYVSTCDGWHSHSEVEARPKSKSIPVLMIKVYFCQVDVTVSVTQVILRCPMRLNVIHNRNFVMTVVISSENGCSLFLRNIGTYNQFRRHHNPEVRHGHLHRCENLRSRIMDILFVGSFFTFFYCGH